MGFSRPSRRVALLALALTSVPFAATAQQDPPRAFAVREQSRDAALMELARQAGVSLGFAPEARCGGRAGITGRMSLNAALERLLAGSACAARRPNVRTVIITAAPKPSSPAPAAAPAVQTTELAELVVTADRTEQLLSQASSALTAISGAELARLGVANDQDLGLLAAGVSVTNFGPGRDKIILRGLSDGPLTGHAQSTVGLYLGELRLTYNAPDPDLPLIDLARVEVFRGPQGSLYGAGSIGGVLRLVPNAPDSTARSGWVSASMSDTAHGDWSGGLQGGFNLPLDGGRGGVRAVGWTERSGGAIDDPGRDLHDIDRTRRRGLRVGSQWRISPDLSVNAMVIAQTIYTRDAHYAEDSAGPLARSSSIAQPHDNDFAAAAIGARWTPEWGELTVDLGVLDHDVSTTYDASGGIADPVSAGSQRFDDGNEIRALVFEARAASASIGPWGWKLGVFAAEGQQTLNADISGTAVYAETRRDLLDERAVFGEVSYDLTPSMTLAAGGRLFRGTLRTRSDVTLGAAARRLEGATRATGFAPRIVLTYRPGAHTTLYAQAAEGYRLPGLNTSGAPDQPFSEPGGRQPLRRYAGDELWSYELGVRWRSDPLGLTTRLAAFETNWRDIQSERPLPSGLLFTATLGDGGSRGLEAEATWRRAGFEFRGSVVWQESELNKAAVGILDLSDRSLPGVPHVSYAMAARRAWTLGSDLKASLRLAYAYIGRSRLVLTDGDARTMGDYGDLRLSATLSSSDITGEIFVENLLDEDGDTLPYGNPFLKGPVSTPQRPRTTGVRITREF